LSSKRPKPWPDDISATSWQVLAAATREVSDTVDPARAALEALLDGPSESETEDGLSTRIPITTELVSFDLTDGVATLDLTGLDQATDPVHVATVIAQVVRTLVAFPSVEQVRLQEDGEPWGLVNMAGEIAAQPYDEAQINEWEFVCSGHAGSEAEEDDCFSAVGTGLP
jgi:spore germination protein GerM